ncbi:Gata transcription factor 11 [Heracleum sosnowskyi]|uniref:Gata transcription factor 11 n=1 Tax=Heracleum sosnowskyi TaxID=360622 RepID=A0AAD8H9X3_9APIA|nr:Gata transcription factor 11 [Heracleum sosnowskyi]
MEALDDLLNFSDDDEENTKLPFSSSSFGHKDDDPLSVPEFAEEELEWLSNKDAFPSIETCMDIISGQSGIFPDDQNHPSPISVLENSGTSYIGNLMVPISFPVRGRSKRLRKRRSKFPELCVKQQGRQWNQVSVENLKQEQESPLLLSKTVSRGAAIGRKQQGRQWNQVSMENLKQEQESPLLSKTVSRGAAIGRKCQHCQAEQTPLWRSGPMGPKTLCNACGVRYRSGRLVPEYRPANSPTFSSKLHSNSHRRIMEKRRKSQSGEMMLDGVCGYRVDSGLAVVEMN